MNAAGIAGRIYGHYVQPERLDDLRAVLEGARACGYATMTLSAFADQVRAGTHGNADRILLLRHDIDSDVPRARRMWEIERSLAMVGSYFFRRSTWDVAFMRELSSAGCEVGYHYEELATLVKEHGVATATETRALIGPSRARLRSTIQALRADTGLSLGVFAAHGDFANRAVGVFNVEMLDDAATRAEIGVRLEAYDIEEHVSVRLSDGAPPRGWRPGDPLEAIRRGEPVVAVLLHPRSWGRAPLVNARADLQRLREDCAYRLRRAQRRLRRDGRMEAAPEPE
jgi:hypothetical protein